MTRAHSGGRAPAGRFRALLGLAGTLGVLTSVAFVDAAPQYNVGLVPALCSRHGEGPGGLCFSGGLRGDVMLGRSGSSDIGFGPVVELGTVAFNDVRAQIGPTLQLPFGDVQAVVSATGYVAVGSGYETLGVAPRIFVGARPYNYSAAYGAAFGLFAGADLGLSGQRERNLVLGLHFDGMWSAIPWLALASWLRAP